MIEMRAMRHSDCLQVMGMQYESALLIPEGMMS